MNEMEQRPTDVVGSVLQGPASVASTVLQAVEEKLHVATRMVETGIVQVHKRVHEDVVRIDVPLTSQTVSVERVAIGRDVDAPVEVRWEGDVMIVPVVEERLVWRKQLVLVEELRLTRTSHIVQDTQDVVLRREEIVVDHTDLAQAKPLAR